MRSASGPVEILMAAWQEPDAEGRVLAELRQAEHDHLLSVVDAATPVLGADGRLRITGTKDIGTRRGADVVATRIPPPAPSRTDHPTGTDERGDRS